MTRAAVPLVAGLCWLLGAVAAEAEPLADVLAKVYLASPRLEAGRAELRAADESLPLTRAGRRPQLSTRTSASLNLVQTESTRTALQTAHQSLDLTQPVYDGGKTGAALSQAEAQVRAARARLLDLEQEVLLEAVAAYVAVARDEAVLVLARGNEARLQAQLEAVLDRERLGALTKTDIAQAKARLALAVAKRIAAEGDLRVATAEYRRIVGEPPGQLQLPPPPADLPASLAAAQEGLAANPRLQAAEFELAAARDEVAVAQAGLKPRLTLNGTLGYTNEPSTLLDQETTAGIGATLTIPLFQGGGEYARVRQSKERVAQRRYGIDATRRAAEAEIAAAWEDLQAAEAGIRAVQAQVDAAGFALEGVRQEALVGAREVVDVLDAEQELFAAEVALVEVEAARTLAGYRLLAAIGRLTARDLYLPVVYYDPEAHYRDVRGRWLGLGGRQPAE